MFITLCRNMMSNDPEDRPTASEALAAFEAAISAIDPRILTICIRCDEEPLSIWHNPVTISERAGQLVTVRLFLILVLLFAPLLFMHITSLCSSFMNILKHVHLEFSNSF